MNSVKFNEKQILLTIDGEPVSFLLKKLVTIPVGVEYINYKGLTYFREG
jgi:hypothetical protein